MSKTLIIIRHGKAEEGFDKKDIDRRLSSRGIQQAHHNGSTLQQRQVHPGLLLHSSASRTTETTAIIAEYMQGENMRVISTPNLYLCPSSKILDELVAHAKDTDHTVIIVGHNSGLSDFYNQILSGSLYYNLSTCEMAVISLNIGSWTDLYDKYDAQLLSIEKPNK